MAVLYVLLALACAPVETAGADLRGEQAGGSRRSALLGPRSGVASGAREGPRNGPRGSVFGPVGLPSVHLGGIPHVQQKPGFSGEATLAMWLRAQGHAADQDDVFGLSRVDPVLGRGAWAPDLAVALEGLGVDTTDSWTELPADDPVALNRAFAALHADLLAGLPSIVVLLLPEAEDPDAGDTEQFRLVTGYDAASDEVVFHDPSRADALDVRLERRAFVRRWALPYGPETLTLVRFRLDPEALRGVREVELPPAPPTGPSAADLAQAAMAMRELAGDDGFTLVLEPPYVVAGDEHPDQVVARTRATVRWAHAQLRELYFDEDPAYAVPIWLFRDGASYRGHVQRWLGAAPPSPYGFADVHGLYLDISTGGGTLVHELVHPLVRTNLPGCPPWYNEGLASLYEAPSKRYGQLWGETNWRLPGLRRALAEGRAPSLEALLAMDEATFYDPESTGVNYATARFLVQFLQDRGDLPFFHRRLSRGLARDPTGRRALLKSTQARDLGELEAEWREYVQAL